MSYDFNILLSADGPTRLVQDGADGPYDDVWSQSEIPTQEPVGLERVMLAEDKLFVVLAVVLIIWIGIAALIMRTDRRLDRLENALPATEDEPLHS